MRVILALCMRGVNRLIIVFCVDGVYFSGVGLNHWFNRCHRSWSRCYCCDYLGGVGEKRRKPVENVWTLL